MKKVSWIILGLLVCVLAFGLFGCSTDENTNVTQNPYPEPVVTPWLFSIWGTAVDDVYVVGRPGVILHWNGIQWRLTESSTETLTDVWGTGSSEVYIVGHEGAILRGSGSSWSKMTSGTENHLYAVGQGPYDAIHVVGEKGVIRKLSGSAWIATQTVAYRYAADGTPEDTLVFEDDLQSLTSVTPFALAGDKASVVMENNAAGFDHQWLWGPIEDQALGFIYASASGPVASDNYLANKDGRLFHLIDHPVDGLTWLKIDDPDGNEARPATFPAAITGLWRDDDNGRIVMTTRSGRVATLEIDGSSTGILYTGTEWLSDVWGTGDGEIWVVGKQGLMLFSSDHGATWTTVDDLPLPDVTAKSIGGTDKFGRPLP